MGGLWRLLERHFGGMPLLTVTFPRGFAGDAVFHESYAHVPSTIATVQARTSSGVHSFVRLSAHNVTWLCAAHFVVELDGWGPRADDPQRAAFARLVFSPHGATSEDQVFAGARIARERLQAEGLDAIVVLDGFRGLVLWIPLSDGPAYDRVAAWVRGFAEELVREHPDAFTLANLKAERGDRIYLGLKSNHPGMGTLLPYAVRGTPSLEVALPVAWDELGTRRRNGEVNDETFATYLAECGDVFGAELERIGARAFGERGGAEAGSRAADAVLAMLGGGRGDGPRDYIIAAALAVLADGAAHGADDILARGVAAGTLPASTTRKYVYTALHEYVVRTIGAGRVPALVQVEGSATFRLNEPNDPWPDVALPALPRWLDDVTVTDLAARVRAAAVGADPAAFERVACEAFAALGFLATHYGGNGEPDGVLAAPLGTEGYRAILECKTASPGGIVTNPRPEEPAKFRDGADATKAVLLGPAFGGDQSLDDELRVHGVALWTVDDLVGVLEAQIGPDEVRPMFEAGRAEGALRAILWERAHGRRKRVAVIADRMARAAWQTQKTLAASVAIAETPALTEETLFVLVDEALAAEGVGVGATIEEARAAIVGLECEGRMRRVKGAWVVRFSA